MQNVLAINQRVMQLVVNAHRASKLHIHRGVDEVHSPQPVHKQHLSLPVGLLCHRIIEPNIGFTIFVVAGNINIREVELL